MVIPLLTNPQFNEFNEHIQTLRNKILHLRKTTVYKLKFARIHSKKIISTPPLEDG